MRRDKEEEKNNICRLCDRVKSTLDLEPKIMYLNNMFESYHIVYSIPLL